MHSFESAATIGEQHGALEAIILVTALTARVGSKSLGGIRQEGHTVKYAPEIGKSGLRHTLGNFEAQQVIIPGVVASNLHLTSVNVPRESGRQGSVTTIRYDVGRDGSLRGASLSDLRMPERPMYWPEDPLNVVPTFHALNVYVKTILHTCFAVLPHHAYMYASRPKIAPIPYSPAEIEIYRPRHQR